MPLDDAPRDAVTESDRVAVPVRADDAEALGVTVTMAVEVTDALELPVTDTERVEQAVSVRGAVAEPPREGVAGNTDGDRELVDVDDVRGLAVCVADGHAVDV